MPKCFICDVLSNSSILHMGPKHILITSDMRSELNKNTDFNAKLEQVMREVEAL